MTKVLIVLPELETGGGQRMTLEIVRNIHCAALSILIVSLYPRQGNLLEELADREGIAVQYLSKREGADLKVIPQLHRAIKAFRPDVIHANLRVMPYLLLPLCISGVKKCYYTVHNLADKDATGFKRCVLGFSFRFCKVQPVAISELCRRSVAAVYHRKEDTIPCINVGINLGKFARKHPYADLPSSPIRFIAVGRLMAQKNYRLMLSAFAKVHKQYPDTELVILGEGEERPALERQVQELHLQDAVKLEGIVSHVAEYLHTAHIYLLSSDYEGLPQSVLEAMAAGLPIVTTEAGGVADVMRQNENGIVVPCGDEEQLAQAMKRLVQSQALCLRFSEKGTELVQQYSIQNCAEQYRRLYLQ